MTEPLVQYTGSLDDGTRVLVTVWDDEAEIALRDSDSATWGPPTYLQKEAT